jgi:surface antigen
MPKILKTLGLLALCALVWSPGQADAGQGKHKHKRKHERVQQEERYDAKKGEYKYEYKDGNCKYEYKSSRKGTKEEYKCKGRKHRARHAGGPPPWAPAHGYRRQQGGGYQATYEAPFDLRSGRCDRSALGVVLGIGSQVAKGDERTAAIIGGSIIGALVGGSIGRSMDEVDQNCVGQALEHAPDGKNIMWNEPEDGSRYQVTPVETYQDNGGRYCREYQTVSVVGGRTQETYGTACRQPDGSWRLMN